MSAPSSWGEASCPLRLHAEENRAAETPRALHQNGLNTLAGRKNKRTQEKGDAHNDKPVGAYGLCGTCCPSCACGSRRSPVPTPVSVFRTGITVPPLLTACVLLGGCATFHPNPPCRRRVFGSYCQSQGTWVVSFGSGLLAPVSPRSQSGCLLSWTSFWVQCSVREDESVFALWEQTGSVLLCYVNMFK